MRGWNQGGPRIGISSFDLGAAEAVKKSYVLYALSAHTGSQISCEMSNFAYCMATVVMFNVW